MLTDFTDYASIRALLGLTAKELPDTLLASEIYSLMLDAEHAAISASLVADYEVAQNRTDAASVAFSRAVRIFSAHAVAYKCADALPMFSVKAITDGKAGVYRDGNSPYNGTMLKISVAYFAARATLATLYGTYLGTPVATAAPAPLLGISSPTLDPVTGA